MANPWLKKNPFMSMWLSGANAAAGRASGQATAQARAALTKLDFPHFCIPPACYPAAQKMSSDAMNRRASSMGRMVRPNGPTLVQRSFHSDQ
jgi:hypothetical protein